MDQRMQVGNEQSQVSRQHGQQVDYAKKTGGIAQGIAKAQQPAEVFERKKRSKQPFDNVQRPAMPAVDRTFKNEIGTRSILAKKPVAQLIRPGAQKHK